MSGMKLLRYLDKKTDARLWAKRIYQLTTAGRRS